MKPQNCITYLYHNHTVYSSLLASHVIGYAIRTKMKKIEQMATQSIQLDMYVYIFLELYIHGLVQEKHNSVTNALEFHLSLY